MSSPLSIGVSGLIAFQRALATTSHNVANSGNDGYSRQQVQFASRAPQFSGAGFFGSGVQLGGVNRIFDQIIEDRLRSATSDKTEAETRYGYAARIDRLLADPDVGLSPSLQRFFAAAQEVGNDPTTTAARQVMVTEAESLVDRFRFLDQRLQEERVLLNSQIQTTVEEVNSYAQSLARLNSDIAGSLFRGVAQEPNDLLDERDKILKKMSELVSINTVAQDDGQVNVFFGKGQLLVSANRPVLLEATRTNEDPTRFSVSIASRTGGGGAVDISNQISGGRLGALLETRSEIIDKAQNALGRTAIGLAMEFNAQHVQGIDLNGDPGADFFSLGNLVSAGGDLLAKVTRAPGNSSGVFPEVEISNYQNLTTDNYRLRVVDVGAGTLGWDLRVDGTNQSVPAPADVGLDLPAAPTAPDYAVGDSFLVRPTQFGGNQIDSLITEAREIAAAGAQLSGVADAANTGTASVVSAALNPAPSIPNTPSSPNNFLTDFTLSVDTTVSPNAWSWNNGGAATAIPATNVAVDGDITTITVNGWDIQIQGTPGNNDEFDFSLINPADFSAVGNNTNMLGLADLQNRTVFDNGKTTLNDSYNALLSEVGTRTRKAEIDLSAKERLLDVALADRETISGVNLDEEAANLVRFQQAYQAAAQVIAVSSSLFDSLIAAVRR